MALSGKTAVVTGAAMGIGKAITEILLKNGAKAAFAASDYGIRVNAICPGFVETNLISEIKSQTGQFAHLVDARHHIRENLGVLTATEVAECILELVTDETKNGEALVVVKNSKFYVTFPTLDKSSDKP